MHHRQWGDFDVGEGVEWCCVNHMKVESGRTGIFIVAEAIAHSLMYIAGYIAATEYRESIRIVDAIGSQIIDTTEVVVMVVCHQKRIKMWSAKAKHLFAEVGSAIE